MEEAIREPDAQLNRLERGSIETLQDNHNSFIMLLNIGEPGLVLSSKEALAGSQSGRKYSVLSPCIHHYWPISDNNNKIKNNGGIFNHHHHELLFSITTFCFFFNYHFWFNSSYILPLVICAFWSFIRYLGDYCAFDWFVLLTHTFLWRQLCIYRTKLPSLLLDTLTASVSSASLLATPRGLFHSCFKLSVYTVACK